MHSDPVQGANFGERGEFVFAEFGDAAGQVVDGFEMHFCAFPNQSIPGVLAQAADVAQAHAEGNGCAGIIDKISAVPTGLVPFFLFCPGTYVSG